MSVIGKSMVNPQPSREDVRLVDCPECGAPSGEPCRGRRSTRNGKPWQRKANHLTRVNYFSMLTGDVRHAR